MKAHKDADVLVSFASLRSAYDSTVEALQYSQVSASSLLLIPSQDGYHSCFIFWLHRWQIRTIAIIAEGIPENLTRKLIQMANQKDVTIIGPATVSPFSVKSYRNSFDLWPCSSIFLLDWAQIVYHWVHVCQSLPRDDLISRFPKWFNEIGYVRSSTLGQLLVEKKWRLYIWNIFCVPMRKGLYQHQAKCNCVFQVGGIKPGCFKIGNTGGMLDNILSSKLYRPGRYEPSWSCSSLIFASYWCLLSSAAWHMSLALEACPTNWITSSLSTQMECMKELLSVVIGQQS